MPLPDGPRLPALLQGVRFVVSPVAFFDDCRRRFGDPFTVRLPVSGPVVLFSDPAAIREIFTGDPDTLRAGEANAMLRPILGPSSLLLLDGDRHLRDRRMMLPPFHGDRMLAYGAVMRDVTMAAVAGWPIGRPFPVLPETQAITLEVILRTVFGVSDPLRRDRLRDRLRRFVQIAMQPLLMWPPLQKDLGPRWPWGRFVRLRAEIDVLLDAEIAARRTTDGATGDDVLSLIVAARDERGRPMPDADVRDELMTLLLAGHETTATGLAWTLHRVLSEPDVLDRLREELDRVTGGVLEPAHVADLLFLDATVKETLRLNPVIPDVMRVLDRPLRIGGWDLPAGIGVAPNIHAAHRRADVWPDPTRFDPGRFLGARPSPYAFLPFGGGARRCLGMAFALYEMKVVLATVLAQAELALAPGYRPRVVRRNVTWAPSRGMPIVLRSRRLRPHGPRARW